MTDNGRSLTLAESLRHCLQIFEQLGDREGVDACLRCLADVAASDPLFRAVPLSSRERQVATLVAAGLTNREIARALRIAEGTARRHVANILTKLGLHSRIQLARWVITQ
jgi:DNA-binding NarL/FixJ family response regulator